MYYVYILYSQSFDKYYIGSSDDPELRLLSHNTSARNTFTSKFRPWILMAYYGPCESRREALKFEKQIKSKKKRTYIEWLVSVSFIQTESFPLQRLFLSSAG